ncbi:hypothetical protein M3B76_008215 [Micrococcus luteus]|nr:hypothetical protein [Micrococcus luteus]
MTTPTTTKPSTKGEDAEGLPLPPEAARALRRRVALAEQMARWHCDRAEKFRQRAMAAEAALASRTPPATTKETTDDH